MWRQWQQRTIERLSRHPLHVRLRWRCRQHTWCCLDVTLHPPSLRGSSPDMYDTSVAYTQYITQHSVYLIMHPASVTRFRIRLRLTSQCLTPVRWHWWQHNNDKRATCCLNAMVQFSHVIDEYSCHSCLSLTTLCWLVLVMMIWRWWRRSVSYAWNFSVSSPHIYNTHARQTVFPFMYGIVKVEIWVSFY